MVKKVITDKPPAKVKIQSFAVLFSSKVPAIPYSLFPNSTDTIATTECAVIRGVRDDSQNDNS